MLPYHLSAMKPMIEAKSRLIFLTSKSDFGSTDINDEHLVQRLDAFVGNYGKPEPHQMYDKIRNVPYPSLTREKVIGQSGASDILLKDICRQNKGIEERYRKGLIDMHSLRKLADIGTRYHISMSRGLERHLINQINDLDSEAFNRKTVKPLI